MHCFSLTDDVYSLLNLQRFSAVLQEVVSVTVSTIQYSNAYHSIKYQWL